ncbi:hypothetical protein [Rubritalea tangerina]
MRHNRHLNDACLEPQLFDVMTNHLSQLRSTFLALRPELSSNFLKPLSQ